MSCGHFVSDSAFLHSYLDEIERITALMYFPRDGMCFGHWSIPWAVPSYVLRRIDDVLKARLKTTGVIEHTFSLTSGEFKGVDWKIYDVGGSQQQRHAWAPYFDDGVYMRRPLPSPLSPLRPCTLHSIG